MSLCLAAAALTFGVNMVSYHTDTSAGYNNTNPGIYVAYDGWAAGTYYNSLRRQTVWAARIFESDSCRYGLMLGLATGYNAKVIPMVVPSVKFDLSEISKNTNLRISLMPTARENKLNGVVFHTSIEFSF